MFSCGLQFLGVMVFKASAVRLVNAYARHNPGQVYLYSFDYIGEHTRWANIDARRE